MTESIQVFPNLMRNLFKLSKLCGPRNSSYLKDARDKSFKNVGRDYDENLQPTSLSETGKHRTLYSQRKMIFTVILDMTTTATKAMLSRYRTCLEIPK